MKRLSLLLAVSLLFICQVSRSQTLPSGFSTTTIGSGWNLPLGTAFSNDGQKMFVWEKDGRIYVCNRNTAGAYIKQTTPVLDISEEVANWGDHGLMGFALDPNYLSNGLIYLLYVVDRHHLINFGTPAYNPATSSGGATIGRITRYKTTTSGSNTIIDPTSRFILLGETRQAGIAVMHDGHGMGGLAFAADGTLLATAGDAASYYLVDKGSDSDTDFGQALADGIIRPAENVGAFRAQILNSHNGKLLRIDPVTGNGVGSNPYYSAAQPRSPKSRVWAFGLRNPYRFSIKPGTGSTNPAAGDVGEIFLGDVGWNTYEEVTIVTTPGVNCGWPLYEGLTAQPGYTSAVTANLDEPNPLFGIGGCTKQYFNFQDLIKQVTADNNKTIYNSCNPATPIGTGTRYVHHRPSMDWRHFTNEARVGIFSGNTATTAMVGSAESNVIGTPFPGNCATGGPWYNGTSFPATYQNKYFVADHDGQWIKCFSVDFTDVVTEVKNFGTGFLGTVHVNMNPLDGTLVVVELGNFSTIGASIKQIRFGGNQAPIVKMTSDKTFGPSVLNVSFTGNTSSDPDGTIASYAWSFGDGGTSTSANPSHNFTAPANIPTKYVVKLTVTDNLGASSLDSIIISVNNTPPVVNITSPVKNSLYQVGPDTLYNCSATVTDAEHNAAALKYEWQTFLRHNSHVHPEAISTATSPTTSISRIGCNGDDYYWFIKLTVTDAAGLSAVDSSKIFPDCSPGLDNTPPVVSTVSPLNGATNVTTGTTVSAAFNETIDPVTVTGTTFQLKNAANTVIPASINTSFNQLTLTPSGILAGSTVYTATIKGGSSGVKDLAGNALANDYSWSFTTVDVDITPPAVTSVSPLNGATGVSTGTTVMANFNEAINVSTVTAATFELRNAGNNIVPATITASSNQIVLTPSSPLTGSTIYTVTIKGGSSGVNDLSGNALVNDFSWTFTTGAVDNVPPTIVSVLPANAAIGVGTGATITANFNESVNPSTITATTFQLKDAANNIVAATINTLSNQIILTPSSALAGSTTYTVTIAGEAAGVKDLTGNALASNYSWSFTTVAVIPPALVTIQSVDTKTGAAATVHSLTAVPAGALLVLSTTADAVVSDCIVSSSPSLTWIKRVDAGATSSDNAEIWTAVYAAGGSITITSNWGTENSETSVCYVVLNAESVLAGAFGTAVLQAAPSVTINTTRENSIIFGCTADWKAINGATRTLRDAATERLYFKDGNYTTYHYTKAATTIAPYTEGVSLPSNQQASTALLEIRGATGASNITPPIVTTQPGFQIKCAGTVVSFNSEADGSPVPTVQWQESINGTNWTNIPGAVNSTLSFATTIADNNKQYRAVWTNSAGPVSSNPATLTVNSMSAPAVMVVNNCGSSVLTVESISGTLLWSNGATSSSITVTSAGTYTVVQTVDGCISDAGNGIATPKVIPSAPLIDVADNCGSSTLTASGFAGSLLWSTGETTASITVATAGTYTVTQTVNECVSAEGSAIASPKTIPPAPAVTVVNNCGQSVLTAASFTGTLLWSTGETTASISVTTAETYTVTQTVNGCISAPGSGIAAPIISSVTSPTITVIDNCGNSTLTAGDFTGNLLWSTGETTPAITVTIAGTYTVTQTIDGCTSDPANAVAAPKIIPSAPVVTVADNCGNTVLSAESFTGSLLWNTGEITNSITVSANGIYTVTQSLNGCTSIEGSGAASPKIIPPAPTVIIANNCGNSLLTASDFTGSLLWSTGETTTSITVSTGGTYTVAQIVNGCTSAVASGIAAPLVVPSAPIVTVTDNCGSSLLTASGYTGSLLWSTGETTESITVTTGGTYTVTQKVGGCASADGSGIAAPKLIPPAPIVTIANNCGNSVLTASVFTGSVLWSTGETTSSITVTTGGIYTITQTINGCESAAGSGLAEPINSVVPTPTILVFNDCGQSILTAMPTGELNGTYTWSNGSGSSSVTVTTGGTYTVIYTVNGCPSALASAIATPKAIPAAPAVEVVNNCESSILNATNFTGTLLWSTNETTPFITVTNAGNYSVTQTVDGCTSAAGNGTAAPAITPTAPSIAVTNNCGHSVLTASGFTGALLWSTGETTSPITVATGGTYTVTQTVNGCESAAGAGLAEPINSVVATPTIVVVDDCGQSVLTAGDFTGTLLWSTGATTPSITVTNAGTYTVTQTVNGCSSVPANGIATPKIIPGAPTVEVVNNCESSILTASDFTGSLLWRTGETTSFITVTSAGNYTVTQTVDGCTSAAGNGTAAPVIKPTAPSVTVTNNCGHSVLTASGFTGALVWSTGETTSSIMVTTGGTYTVTQTVNDCTGDAGSGLAEPINSVVSTPTIVVVDDCDQSVLTAEGFTGTLLWSTGEITSSITVTNAGTYTVTQTVNGCSSAPAIGIATPKIIPAAPTVEVVNNCESSILTASNITGSLLWSTTETSTSISVNNAGSYTVTQTVNGCISSEATTTALPKAKPVAPSVSVVNNCGYSVLTASNFTGSLLWSNGATSSSITVNDAGIYTVTQTVDGCLSDEGSATAAPFNAVVDPPTITVVNDCNSSTLTAESFTGALLWSNGAATPSITVSTPGTYSVTQTVNGCTSFPASGTAVPLKSTIETPSIIIFNDCGSSTLMVPSYTGSLSWNNGTANQSQFITVTEAGTYFVTQTVNGCTSEAGYAEATPKAIPSAPGVTVVNNCGSSILTASGFTGPLLWSNGETTASITVNLAGTYTVTQTINGCISEAGTAVAAPKAIPSAPTVSVVDNCGSSTLTAGSFTGSLLWSNAATTISITVNPAATYTVTQTINGCTSEAGAGVAAPKTIPVLSGNLAATAISGTAFAYTPASATSGTTFAWSRAAVAGISNTSASGTGNINETLINTLSTAVNVTYVYTLTSNGCINTQNVVVNVSSVPVVTSVSPANGTTGINISSSITANFSEAINGTTVTATTVQLKDAANNIIPATINTSSSLITLTPSAALTNSTTYTVTIKGGTSGVKGVAGNAMVNDYSWSFTTVAAPSLPPVTIQSVTTKTGIAATSHPLTGVPPGALLVLATTADAIVSNCAVSSSPVLTWTKRVDAGASQSDNAEIWTAVYTAGGSITVNSNWGTDNSQTSVCYVVLNAEPVLGGASAIATLQSAPSVTITTTRENSIIFGCTADWKAINGATRTLRDAATERLYFRDGHYTTYYYTKAATTIAAYTEGVSVPTGQQASTALLEIRSVSGAPDITPPTITSVSPVNGATGVAVNTTVSAIFNEAMNAATISGSTIELRNASNALIAATVSYNATTRTATVTTSTVLANSTVYTAKVISGASGVKDAAGNALTNDYSWSFTTVVGDITPPTVTSVTPANGATGISIGTTASAIFNEAMDASTINNSTIELRNASNALITATLSFNAATRTATLTPSAPLSNSTLYTVTIKAGASGVKDIAGNALAIDYSWSFTTVVADLTPPTVTSVTPLNGATGVSVSTTVTAIFNEAMNATTINSSTVELRNASNILITATVSYNAATGTSTLTPSNILANSTVYTAKVISGTSGVKDAAGNALAIDYSWSFTTGTSTPQSPITIQSVTTKTGIAATSHPLTGVPPGALLVLATTADAIVSNCAVSSSPVLTWTKRVDAGASQSDNAEIWTAVYAAGGSITVNSNWGTDNSQTSVCYVVLNAEPVLGGASAIATLQSAPSVTITTTRENSIIFGCTADWKAINGATRTLRDAATERLYFRDGHYTTYYYTKAAATIASYTQGVSLPTGQQASTALLEIRSAATVLTRPASPVISSVAPPVMTENLEINVMPNPSSSFFNLVIKGNVDNLVQIRVTDISGRLVERYEKIGGNMILSIGHGWSGGFYFVEVIQGNQRKLVKIVKVN